MITPEMIERAREKHYFQFYESGKNGTTFELGDPIYGTDCAIDTPISKDTWTPSKLADYIESQRKVPSKALDVKYCENMLRNICGEWKNFSEAYGTYDKEYLRKHPFHSCNELKNYVSSYQPEAISNIRKDYDTHTARSANAVSLKIISSTPSEKPSKTQRKAGKFQIRL